MPPHQRANAQPDTYSPTETARVLGISEKRVRQLVDGGKLEAIPNSRPLRIIQRSVIEEKERRKREGVQSGGQPAAKPAGLNEEAIAVVAKALAAEMIPRAIEGAERQAARTEAYFREENERLRAEVLQLRAQLADATRRRRWWARPEKESVAGNGDAGRQRDHSGDQEVREGASGA